MMEGRFYTTLGFLLLASVGYLNYSTSGNGFRIRIPFPWLQPKMSFIVRNGTRFVDAETGSPAYVNGWNSYWMMSSDSPESIEEMLRRGRAMGMTVCRTWAFNDGGSNPLQIAPGIFNEKNFQGLDYIIYEARRNNVRLILSLVNNLSNFGGKPQYVKWAKEAGANVPTNDSFYSHPTVKRYYKDYIKAILTRKNSFSGVTYSDEPAIFAWELMNEPRCTNSSAPLLQAWIAEMAAYVKSLDQKHLVTVGLEGFYGFERTERLGVNPGLWAASLGSDFIRNSAVEHIDFASVHAYPDTWMPMAGLEEKVKYLSNWVDSHVNDSEHVLRKPVLFSEVGSRLEIKKNGLSDRDILLKMVYDKVYESAKKGQAGAGALIWQLTVEGMIGNYHDQFSLVARENPSTYKLILQQSCRLKNLFSEKGETNSSVNQPCAEPRS